MKKAAKGVWREADITRLLAAKHAADVFVSGLKSGSTVKGTLIMDGWAMPRSWAHPSVTGYEIKVSRSDWLKDNKWQSYLGMCNQLYIVCPRGILEKEDIPDPLGLMHAVRGETAGRVLLVKKAAWREVSIPEDVFRYILMWRATIGEERQSTRRGEGSLELWRAWLEGRIESRNMGRAVSKKLDALIKAESDRDTTDKFQGMYAESQEKLHALEKVLSEAGIHSWHGRNLDKVLMERLRANTNHKFIEKQLELLRMVLGNTQTLIRESERVLGDEADETEEAVE